MIAGREFLLAGRGTRKQCEAQREWLKREWRCVRLLPYGWGGFGASIDDYSLWVHDRRQEHCEEKK